MTATATISVAEHYKVRCFDLNDRDRHCAQTGMRRLREMFADGEADHLTVALFSTSGIHGSYTTIEDIEDTLARGPDPFSDDCALTVLVLRPRTCVLLYGQVCVGVTDIAWLKRLRDSSHAAMAAIGRP